MSKQVIKYAMIAVGVISILALLAFFIHSCNDITRDATKDVPVIGKIVDAIQKKIPPILGGTKPPAVPEEKAPDMRPSRFMWNPRIDVGVGMGTTMKPEMKDFIPKVGVGVSIASYGKSKADTKYRFGRIGIQTNMKEVEATLAPVMIRLGGEKHPLFSNTYLYPYVGYNIQRNSPTVGIGISLSF